MSYLLNMIKTVQRYRTLDSPPLPRIRRPLSCLLGYNLLFPDLMRLFTYVLSLFKFRLISKNIYMLEMRSLMT